VNDSIPVPPGAEDESGNPIRAEEPEVVDAEFSVTEPAPADEEPKGLFQRAWANLKAAAHAVGSAIGTAAGWTAGKVQWVYAHTLGVVLDYVELYVPGCAQLRSAMFWYTAALVIIGAVLGGLIFAEAGYILPMVFVGMIIGAVLVPALIVLTPAVWLSVLADLWMLSIIYITIDTVVYWLKGEFEDAGFWKAYITMLAPGWAVLYADWKEEREETLEAAEADPVPATA